MHYWVHLLVYKTYIKKCYIRMPRKVDKLILYTSCHITPHYALCFHRQNSGDSSNVAGAIPAEGVLVRFALVSSCLRWPCSDFLVSSTRHTKHSSWGCVLPSLLILPQQWVFFFFFHLKWWFSLALPAISCPHWLELFHITSPFRALVIPSLSFLLTQC